MYINPARLGLNAQWQTCHRINDRYPAGIVTLSGEYLQDPRHRSELVNLIKHQDLDLAFDEDGYFLRINWRRDN